MVGRTVSHYRIVAELGSGGMGVVYRADDLKLGRAVALKFISAELASQEQAIRRLRAEARAASALNHPNICTIYDIDEHEGHPFIVMELMKGRSLRERLSDGILKTQHLADIGIECADALHTAHSEGIVHRDIKPGNVYLTENGHVKLLDFGVAKLAAGYVGSTITSDVAERTAAGLTVGTVAYMSPEQATGEELDARTDLFSLGVVLYECATGHHPFPGKTSGAILAAIINRTPAAPVTFNSELPLRLQDVIQNCLEKDRELRYQSAADLRADLRRVRRDIQSGHSRVYSQSRAAQLSGSTSPEAPTNVAVSGSQVEAARSTPSRWRVALAAAAIVAAVSGVVGFYALRQFRSAPAATANRTEVARDPTIDRRLAQANAAVESRNYAAAITYADEVLALEPGHAAATRIRNDAQSALRQLDAAIAEARRRIANRDIGGATKALETARAIDPSAASVGDVAARLAEQVRSTDAAAATARPPAQTTRAERPPVAPAPNPQRIEPAPTPAAPADPPPVDTSAQPQRPLPAPPPSTPLPAVSAPPAAVATPPPTTATAPPAVEPPAPAPAKPAVDQDEVAIRNVIATYRRAIESKDLALFRSIKPNLSREEERRLQEGFRAVTSQQVTISILSIDRRGDRASVLVRRRDVIQAGARQHSAESQQTLTLARTGDGWVISEIR